MTFCPSACFFLISIVRYGRDGTLYSGKTQAITFRNPRPCDIEKGRKSSAHQSTSAAIFLALCSGVRVSVFFAGAKYDLKRVWPSSQEEPFDLCCSSLCFLYKWSGGWTWCGWSGTQTAACKACARRMSSHPLHT